MPPLTPRGWQVWELANGENADAVRADIAAGRRLVRPLRVEALYDAAAALSWPEGAGLPIDFDAGHSAIDFDAGHAEGGWHHV